ncbi:hypothetical protein AB6O49_10535 [Streptomyces sp. SBR177]
MPISSPIPVLQGDRGTELRSSGEELVLRRRDAELRIPFAAIARVRAARREVAVELTAPAGTEPTVHRIEDVSAAAASVFAEAVNAALPERAPGEETVDGATLVVTRSLVFDAEDGEGGGDGTDVEVGLARHGTWPMYAAYAVAARSPSPSGSSTGTGAGASRPCCWARRPHGSRPAACGGWRWPGRTGICPATASPWRDTKSSGTARPPTPSRPPTA